VYGVAVSQKRNDAVITPEMMANVVTAEKITDDAVRDLVIASIAVKYVFGTRPRPCRYAG
jgi:phosphoribosylaminoimidazolecarboxamide formyltransferase/IMP cyclohydrolase